ncbi:hypothetical protein Q9Q95_17245 [Sphingomonas sp. DG1-23]|uniref:hypothetical protein n=1 Tax=Sphingomonas sp. DG1-23 TaxID=3068316 RepID=UPI00273D4399|nr:hypothetical protein [Sphingomonas sp. DG1-23]MDP5280675.1 hypothetical protein [Sphingomonas sp. DG1-23]
MDFLLRIAIALLVLIVAGFSWASARKILGPWHRLPLDFALAMLTATYTFGCGILYLFQIEYLHRFYGNGAFLPTRTSFTLILALAALPYLVVPWSTVVIAGFGRAGLPARIARAQALPPIRYDSLIIASLIILIGSGLILAPVLPTLASNALGDLFSITSAASLYTQRQLVFQNVTFLQGGIVYSVLPSLAAVILFWPGRWVFLSRVSGIALAVFATLMNLGMFQIGPTLSFFLTCTFCYFATRGGKVRTLAVAVVTSMVLIILTLYSTIKVTGNQLSQIELFLMRLPIPLPYLIQMASEKPNVDSEFISLPHELGEYMFPELRSAQRFVAMPQPAYIDAWFTYHPVISLAVLVLIGGMIVWFGNRLALSGFGSGGRNSRLILWASVAAPTLYYAFQVDIFALFTSAYSVTFVILPAIGILIVNRMMEEAVPAEMHQTSGLNRD